MAYKAALAEKRILPRMVYSWNPGCAPFVARSILIANTRAHSRLEAPEPSMPIDDVHRQWFTCIDRDLQLLSSCFREVLEELGHRDLAQAVPWTTDADPLPARSDSWGAIDRELQVLSIAFQLLNLAEESAAVEARRFGEEQHGGLHEPGLWGQQLTALTKSGLDAAAIADGLADVHVEVVLTAHPTEAKRPVILKQHRALFDALQQAALPHWTDRERRAIRDRMKTQLECLWRTGEMYLYKPDVASELSNAIDYFRMVFPQAVLTLDQRLQETWRMAGLDPAVLRASRLPRLSFGNWVGGDRDGHPLVTSTTTRDTLARLRTAARGLLSERLDVLYGALSLSDLYQPAPESLTQAIENHTALLGTLGAELVAGNPKESWRQFVRLLQARLGNARCPEDARYRRPSELTDDLSILSESLELVGASRLAEMEVAPVARLVDVCGFHMAALDIRQNSAFHEAAMLDLFAAGGVDATGYTDWDEATRSAFLSKELETLRPLTPRGAALGPKAREVLDTFDVLAAELREHGAGGLGALIVSMTRGQSDLLTVYVLAREAGLLRATPEGVVCLLPVVPLFETGEDLKAGPAIMEAFLDHPITKASLAARAGKEQQVMLGYSDSNKTSGLFASHWRLHMAQYYLSELTHERGVRLNLFHGRGGTNSRGAGPTHRFMEALANNSLSGSLRLTEQGETIAQKYGNAPTAAYNLELLLAATAATTLRHRVPYERNARRVDLGERLADYSEASYRSLLDEPGFIAFWGETTPIDALEESFIGSRPSRRTGRRTLEDLRAIPWVFSWVQARYYLPAWYGLGSALQRLAREDVESFEFVCESARSWPFMRYVLSNAETSLSSADTGLMYEYAELVGDVDLRERFYNIIASEHRNTQSMINQIFGAPRTVRRPRMEATLALRESGLRVLHLRQIALLRAWREHRAAGEENRAAALFPSLLLSINAIASGLRTTG